MQIKKMGPKKMKDFQTSKLILQLFHNYLDMVFDLKHCSVKLN
jgi:hypothetical protein